MEPYGKGKKKILIIGEQPSETEDKLGVHLTGESGKFLYDTFKELGFNIEKDCVKTNAIICHPSKTIKEGTAHYCTANVVKLIKQHEPELIIPLGFMAVKSVIGHYWTSDVGSIGRWAGYQIPSHIPNAWICPTYAPSKVLGLEKKKPSMKVIFKNQIKAALKKLKGGRPWDEIPDFKKGIEVIHDPDKAAKAVKGIIKDGSISAFDYEGNMLKPDSKEAKAVTFSICQGNKTISFPLIGKARKAAKKFLESDVKKIAHNMKFEDRWSVGAMETSVKNWHWDTMLAAHCLNSARGTKSLKFLSYVMFGAPAYAGHIDFNTDGKDDKGANTINNINNIDMNDLLLYGGLDSYLTYIIAIKQMASIKE